MVLIPQREECGLAGSNPAGQQNRSLIKKLGSLVSIKINSGDGV